MRPRPETSQAEEAICRNKRMGAGAGARRLYGSHVVCTLLFMDCAEPGDGERVGKGEGNT